MGSEVRGSWAQMMTYSQKTCLHTYPRIDGSPVCGNIYVVIMWLLRRYATFSQWKSVPCPLTTDPAICTGRALHEGIEVRRNNIPVRRPAMRYDLMWAHEKKWGKYFAFDQAM